MLNAPTTCAENADESVAGVVVDPERAAIVGEEASDTGSAAVLGEVEDNDRRHRDFGSFKHKRHNTVEFALAISAN